jgi:ATP-dependent Clp protease ATP-binding subunit ClpC
MLREADEVLEDLFLRLDVDPKQIRDALADDSVATESATTSPDLPLAEETKRVLAFAVHEAESMGDGHVGTEHLLLALLRVEESVASSTLIEYGVDPFQLRLELEQRGKEKEREATAQATPNLAEYSRDLTELASRGDFDPLIGRHAEVERVIQILSRRTKNNPLLLGEAGVGKTAIVEGMATRIVEGEVPVPLAQRRILALDLSLLVAGTKYRGQFEERLKGLLKELQGHPEVIIFIDEIHSLIGTGSAEGVPGRREYSQTRPVPRRDHLHRCDNDAGVSPARRERPRALTPFSGRYRATADRRRDDHDSAGCEVAVRGFPRRSVL